MKVRTVDVFLDGTVLRSYGDRACSADDTGHSILDFFVSPEDWLNVVEKTKRQGSFTAGYLLNVDGVIYFTIAEWTLMNQGICPFLHGKHKRLEKLTYASLSVPYEAKSI